MIPIVFEHEKKELWEKVLAERERAREGYDVHIARLDAVLTKGQGFPALDYQKVVELSGRPDGEDIFWSRALKMTPGYLEATDRIRDTVEKGMAILDEGYAIPSTVVDQLWGVISEAFERPVHDDGSSFHTWVGLGGPCLDAGIESGAVQGLLYRIGDESISDDQRMRSFTDLGDKYCGMSPSMCD